MLGSVILPILQKGKGSLGKFICPPSHSYRAWGMEPNPGQLLWVNGLFLWYFRDFACGCCVLGPLFCRFFLLRMCEAIASLPILQRQTLVCIGKGITQDHPEGRGEARPRESCRLLVTILPQGSADIFCKEPNSKYLRLCTPFSLS